NEIGVRIALGARAVDVVGLVLKQGLALATIGVAIGLAASLALTRLMKGLLFGVSATDPLTFIVIALLLVGVALMAALVPARRAAKVDPMAALRREEISALWNLICNIAPQKNRQDLQDYSGSISIYKILNNPVNAVYFSEEIKCRTNAKSKLRSS